MSNYCSHSCAVAIDTIFVLFFFNDTATTEIYTLSLHDALPIFVPGGTSPRGLEAHALARSAATTSRLAALRAAQAERSEEHTSELQSQSNLVCRLLLEKKNRLSLYYRRLTQLTPAVVGSDRQSP